MPDTEASRLTFDDSATEFVLAAFELRVVDGYVLTSDGSHPPTMDGDPIRAENVAGVVTDGNGDPLLLRRNFAELAEYVSNRGES